MTPLAALDPRTSLAARVGWVAALPMSAAWLIDAAAAAGPLPLGRVLAGWAAIGAASALAGSVAATAVRRVGQRLHARAADDLAPIARPPGTTHEVAVLADAVDRLLDGQRAVAERHQRLVAEAAHQLRTPLAALRARLQAAAPGALDAQVPELLQTVDRATHIANEFLARAKIDQRRQATPHHAPLRLDELAHEAALEFSPLIAQKRLAFELDAVPQSVSADPWMAGELIRNLLANAIGHTPAHRPLGIVVREALGAPELVVWDSGPGIADAQRERLFEPFAAATRGTGVGLGLSICRQLAQAMGAEVQLFNRSDGERVVGVDAVVRWSPAVAPEAAAAAVAAAPSPASRPVPFPVPLHGAAVTSTPGDFA